jgi:hypothetical protein
MPAFSLAVINEAAIADAEVGAFVASAQEYIDKWLAAFWPEVAGSTIRAAPFGGASASEAVLTLAPNTTLANSMGYHDKTSAGLPQGIVELDSCLRYGVAWTIAASHELAELLVNPKLDRFAAVGDRSYPLEIADPTTAGTFAIGTVMMSNFSTPAYWDAAWPAGSRFDAMNQVRAPLPTIPHDGWLEWSESGVYASAYGADMTPEMIVYMRSRKGRRWRWRGRR